VTKAKCKGTIRFIGTPYSVKDSGVFYGIELDKPKGKNNGTVKGRWYFTCKDKYGTFVQASGISLDGAKAKDSAPKKKTGKKKKTDKKKTEEKKEEPKEEVEYKVGDRVMVKPTKKGQIKWIGEAKEFGAGTYYGIRLTEARGDCDGEWKEVRFFQCPENFGVYVQKRMIVKPIEGDFDFMNEEEKYEEEARAKAEVYKKEAEKLKRLREKFNELDKDGNQTIDENEFKIAAKDIFDCSDAEANALFKEIDVNGSGEISFAEFDNWVDKLGGIEKLEKPGDDDDNKDAEEPKEEEPKEEEEAQEEEPKEEASKEEEEPKEDEPKEDEAKDEEPKDEEPKEEAGDYNADDAEKGDDGDKGDDYGGDDAAKDEEENDAAGDKEEEAGDDNADKEDAQ